MTKKKTARKKKIKDLKLNKETVENLSDKSKKVRGGGLSNTACAGQICGPTAYACPTQGRLSQCCPSAGCVYKK